MADPEYQSYRKIKLLGEGSFGKAYLVECVSDNSLCVIKQVDLNNMPEEEKKETIKEARILEALRHPNIVRFREVYKTKKGRLCIVMDYADGGDLAKKIKDAKNCYFKETQILDWFTQLSLAIKHVHDRKIIHRDLKTQNIFLNKENTILLGDFGIARVLNNTREKVKTMVGTPYYLSPEIIESKDYSFKTDIWSLGIILYELCALKPPFDAQSIHQLAIKIVRGQYAPLPNVYSRELRNLVSSLLTMDPNKRPNIHEVLKMPIIYNRIRNCLTESIRMNEFSHTILHKKNFVSDNANINPCPEQLLPYNQKQNNNQNKQQQNNEQSAVFIQKPGQLQYNNINKFGVGQKNNNNINNQLLNQVNKNAINNNMLNIPQQPNQQLQMGYLSPQNANNGIQNNINNRYCKPAQQLQLPVQAPQITPIQYQNPKTPKEVANPIVQQMQQQLNNQKQQFEQQKKIINQQKPINEDEIKKKKPQTDEIVNPIQPNNIINKNDKYCINNNQQNNLFQPAPQIQQIGQQQQQQNQIQKKDNFVQQNGLVQKNKPLNQQIEEKRNLIKEQLAERKEENKIQRDVEEQKISKKVEREEVRQKMKQDILEKKRINQNNDVKIEWFGPLKPKEKEEQNTSVNTTSNSDKDKNNVNNSNISESNSSSNITESEKKKLNNPQILQNDNNNNKRQISDKKEKKKDFSVEIYLPKNTKKEFFDQEYQSNQQQIYQTENNQQQINSNPSQQQQSVSNQPSQQQNIIQEDEIHMPITNDEYISMMIEEFEEIEIELAKSQQSEESKQEIQGGQEINADQQVKQEKAPQNQQQQNNQVLQEKQQLEKQQKKRLDPVELLKQSVIDVMKKYEKDEAREDDVEDDEDNQNDQIDKIYQYNQNFEHEQQSDSSSDNSQNDRDSYISKNKKVQGHQQQKLSNDSSTQQHNIQQQNFLKSQKKQKQFIPEKAETKIETMKNIIEETLGKTEFAKLYGFIKQKLRDENTEDIALNYENIVKDQSYENEKPFFENYFPLMLTYTLFEEIQ